MSRPRIVACALTLAAVAAGLAASGEGSAAPKVSARDKDKAEKAYQASLDLYRKGQYRAAIEKLEEARAIDGEAKELPYNLGLVHEKLGELDDAIKYFEIYLTLETDEGEKDRVKATIRRLEGARRDLRAAAAASSAAAAPPPPPASASASEDEKPPPPRSNGRFDGWVMATGGVSVVALATGTFFGVRALTSRPSNPTTGSKTSISDLQSSADSAHQKAVLADVFLAVGVATGAAAAYLYFGREADPPVQAVIAPTPRGAAAGILVKF